MTYDIIITGARSLDNSRLVNRKCMEIIEGLPVAAWPGKTYYRIFVPEFSENDNLTPIAYYLAKRRGFERYIARVDEKTEGIDLYKKQNEALVYGAEPGPHSMNQAILIVFDDGVAEEARHIQALVEGKNFAVYKVRCFTNEGVEVRPKYEREISIAPGTYVMLSPSHKYIARFNGKDKKFVDLQLKGVDCIHFSIGIGDLKKHFALPSSADVFA